MAHMLSSGCIYCDANTQLVHRARNSATVARAQVQWEVLVVDEGHRLKNAASRLAEALRGYSFQHRVLLTGTPIQNSLAELWALLNFVLPAVFDCADSFDEWFAAPFRVRLAAPL